MDVAYNFYLAVQEVEEHRRLFNAKLHETLATQKNNNSTHTREQRDDVLLRRVCCVTPDASVAPDAAKTRVSNVGSGSVVLWLHKAQASRRCVGEWDGRTAGHQYGILKPFDSDGSTT